jgi:hypothetical protein
MGIDSENTLEKFDDLVKGCDYDGVHIMIANLQTRAAGLALRLEGGEKRRAFGIWLPPSLTLPHNGGGDAQQLRLVRIAT